MKFILGNPNPSQLRQIKDEGYHGVISFNVATVQAAIEAGLLAYHINPGISTFDQSAFRFALTRKPTLFTHKESWGDLSHQYLKVFADLTGRSSEALRYYLNEMGVDVHVIPNLDKWWTIKDINKFQKQLGLDERLKTSSRLLGEMVQ